MDQYLVSNGLGVSFLCNTIHNACRARREFELKGQPAIIIKVENEASHALGDSGTLDPWKPRHTC